MRNEPNFVRAPRNGRGRPGDPAGERWRETKPISARATRGASALRKRSYGKSYMQQASAKQSQFRASKMPHHSSVPSFQHSRLVPVVRNKPNLPAGPGGTGAWAGDGDECAKRSQFTRRGRAGRVDPGAAPRPSRLCKRTQFLPSPAGDRVPGAPDPFAIAPGTLYEAPAARLTGIPRRLVSATVGVSD